MNACTICQHEKRADIDAALQASRPVRAVAADFGLTFSSVQRHGQKHVQRAPQTASQASQRITNESNGNHSRSERALARFVKSATRLLKDEERDRPPCKACGFEGKDWKAIKGAIEAGTKAISEWGRARGEIRSVAQTQVNVSQSQGVAVELHHHASQCDSRTLLAHGASALSDGVLRGDTQAMRMVADLYALVQAQVSQPSASGATVEE